MSRNAPHHQVSWLHSVCLSGLHHFFVVVVGNTGCMRGVVEQIGTY